MSSAALAPRLPWTVLLYAATAGIGLFELVVLWQAFHPDVSALYRGYYIDRTTTCLDQPGNGDYAFGTEIPFRSGSEKLIKPLRVCGWEGPAGDGLHAVGESSRLHMSLAGSTGGDLGLILEMVAVDFAGATGQRVAVEANGTPIGSVDVQPGTPQRFSFTIPAAIAAGGSLDLELKYPDAILVSPQDADLRKRSIKLSAVRLGPAPASG